MFVSEPGVAPDPNGEQVSGIAAPTEEKVRTAIISAAKRSDIVVVSFHWGTEYSYYPAKRQIALAHAAVEAGADLVLGHHPHVLQGFELIQPARGRNQALIAYSLGNFVFDSPAAIRRHINDSVILTCRFSKNGLISAGFVPVIIENYRPVIAAEGKGRLISDHLNRISTLFDTEVSGDCLIASF